MSDQVMFFIFLGIACLVCYVGLEKLVVVICSTIGIGLVLALFIAFPVMWFLSAMFLVINFIEKRNENED